MSRLSKQRSLVVSALCVSFVLLTGASTHAQNEAVLETPEAEANEDTAVIVVYPNDDEAADDQTRAERSEALDRRAGEQVGDDPRGRAVVLGMYVQESDSDRMKVVEVAAATPAFDAGIRKGDEVVSFDGFKANTYRKWIDGIRKLMNDAREGDTMSIQLMRDGKLLNLRLRKPEARADDLPDSRPTGALDQQLSGSDQLPLPLPQPPQQQQPNQGYGGGNDVTVASFFGGQFGQQLGGTTERAVAEIYRLNGAQQATQRGAPRETGPLNQGQLPADGGQTGANDAQVGGTRSADPAGAAQGAGAVPGAGAAPGAGGGARIGLAGFRDTQNGMLVMLDVGGLSPGNYLVGIGDAGMIGASGAGAGASPEGSPPQREQRRFERPVPPTPQPPRVGPLNETQPNTQQPSNQQPTNQQPTNRGRGAQPQGNHQRLPLEVPATVLAQILPETPQTGQAGTQDSPATGSAQPINTPATGEQRQDGTAQSDISGQDQAGSTTNGAGPGVGPTIPVGTLTVDQSGTGRLQQVVEGVQVQHVVGQAIAIYSQEGGSNTALPPNLNPGAAPAGRPTAGQPATGQPLGGAPGGAAQNQSQSPIDVQPNSAQPGGGQMPVAAGTIRLVSDRRPTGDAGIGTGTQPAANLPATGQELR